MQFHYIKIRYFLSSVQGLFVHNLCLHTPVGSVGFVSLTLARQLFNLLRE